MNAKSFNLSVQGASHIKKNKECQDASVSFYNERMAVAIVCDGHGGDDYMRSAAGSTLAAAVAKKNIVNFLNAITKEQFFTNTEKNMKNLEASIINGWNEAIYMHFNQTPFTEAELSGVSEKARKKYTQDRRIESAYGTTLIAVAMTNEFWFGIHIGDGKCVAVNPEGKFVQPIPWDPKCFLNATTSICDSDALERFRHFYSEKLPVAVFIGSDGIDDCFSNNGQLHNLYKTILYSFGTSEFEEAKDGLKDYLPRLSAKGSGDDVSIAAMFDFDLVPELEVVKEFDREKEKARVEENARKEAEKNEAEKRRVEEEHAKYQQQHNAQSRVRKPMKFCPECGGKLVPGKKFCPSCGTRIELNVIKQEPPKTNDDIQVIPIRRESAMIELSENEEQKLDGFPDDGSLLSEADENMEDQVADVDTVDCVNSLDNSDSENENYEDKDLESANFETVSEEIEAEEITQIIVDGTKIEEELQSGVTETEIV